MVVVRLLVLVCAAAVTLAGCYSPPRDRLSAGHIGLLGIGFIRLSLTNNATRLEDVKLLGICYGNLYRGVVSVTATNKP
jgi:hypothetical protein